MRLASVSKTTVRILLSVALLTAGANNASASGPSPAGRSFSGGGGHVARDHSMGGQRFAAVEHAPTPTGTLVEAAAADTATDIATVAVITPMPTAATGTIIRWRAGRRLQPFSVGSPSASSALQPADKR